MQIFIATLLVFNKNKQTNKSGNQTDTLRWKKDQINWATSLQLNAILLLSRELIHTTNLMGLNDIMLSKNIYLKILYTV